ncbi:T9SS type A sorting domain-containing protein [Ilyomonas limi]|uniref:T9SS type A sorting domain-containing protein n=1 Tax=Ilyomonas limi TaxID=2575867 RepID=A0A4U3L175_9BACT|nr:M36 family metallopeptidase [Ilyomonas limi]TKK67236.1 T9SS type A sorting domain-containing protein [Ilyomonas limi]
MRNKNFCALAVTLLLAFGATAQTTKTSGADASEAAVKNLVIKNSSALGLTSNEARTLRISSSYYDKNAQAIMAYLQQTYKGIDVYNAITVVAFKNGQVISVQPGSVPVIDKKIIAKTILPNIDAKQALRKAAAEVKEELSENVLAYVKKSADGQEFEFIRENANSIFVRLMWVPADDEANNYLLGWQVSLHSHVGNALWLIKIDAQTGNVIKKDNLTVSCNFTSPRHLHKMECFEQPAIAAEDNILQAEAVNSAKYNVIPYPFSDPNFTAPVLVTNPWTMFADADAYTLNWNSDAAKDYDSTRGNNVYAQPDLDGKNNTLKQAARSSTALPNLTFNFTPNFSKDALSSAPTRNFGVTNLFYWNNIMHDMSYQYGFDEAAGNFQKSNLNRGGKGNDYVIADAQDASGTNNANFATPADGSNPRMQMFLWSPSPFKTCFANKPAAFTGFKMASESSFSTNNKIKNAGAITANVVIYKDAGTTTSLGCNASSNAAALAGKIAYIDRGNCDFVTKAKNAQNAGAIAVLIGDNVDAQSPILMGGTDNTITIPAFSILKSVADSIKDFRRRGIVVNITLQPGPQIDGDLDNGVVSHEYTHGISNRLTGGPNIATCLSNKESGSMGEGWSDYMGLMVTTNWATAHVNDGFNIPRPIGNYAFGLTPEFGGIRYYPYSTDFNVNPWTYDSLASSDRITNGGFLVPYDPHTPGEVWCNMLWTMTWDIIAQDGINASITDASKTGGNIVAMKLVMQGMKMQKCNPGFVDARNGILEADTLLFGGAYSNIIWKAFAKRGLGYSANQKKSNNLKDGIAAYDLPPGVNNFITLNSFDARRQNATAQLTWTTNHAVKTSKYIVERSSDGQAFAAIGTVKATGSNTFSFVDIHPAAGNNIYRIRTVSSSKDNKLSIERTVTFNGAKAIVIAPNPVRNYLKITIPGNTQQLQVKVYNNTGGLLTASSFSGTSATIDVRTLAAGSYYIHIIGDSFNYKEQFIVE